MPAVLWISCDCSSEELINLINIQPYKRIEKGDVVATKAGDKLYDHTLCGFDVSDKDFTDLKPQVDDAIQWLLKNFEALSNLKKINSSSKLDFGFYTEFIDSKIVAQYNTIPAKLMKLAGELNIDIELSQYWHAEDQGAQLN
jgi:hypothetical protein